MAQVVMIRVGEIFLKGNNRKYFEALLRKNIQCALSGVRHTIKSSQNRYYCEDFDPQDLDVIVDALTKVFGIYSISVCDKVRNDFDEIAKAVLRRVDGVGTFRMTVNRADKRMSMNSMEIARELGGVVLRNYPDMQVDLYHPDVNVQVDIRENGYTYVYSDTIAGVGGLPVGCSGEGLLLLSGGIDSPVAGYLMAKRGLKVTALHFHSEPYTNELARYKVLRLARKISAYCSDFDIYVVPVTDIQREVHEKCPEQYMVTYTRRFMMRIASKLAERLGIGAIVTGESLGQVASQTIDGMTCSGRCTELPILRPCIAMDKEDIIKVAKAIDTYDISIEPHQDCCTVFLPKNPVIHPKVANVEKYERALDVDALVAAALDKLERYTVVDGEYRLVENKE